MGFDIAAIRDEFPALTLCDDGKPRIYFDNPGGTQVPRSVIERMTGYLVDSNSNLGGFFKTTRETAREVAKARAAMSDLINAPSADEIIFGQNMTSLTMHMSRSVGRHLNAGDEIILSCMDHEGNISPWLAVARDLDLEIKWLPFNVETFEFDLDELEKRLTRKTRLVCIGAASNMLGTINDIESICKMSRDAGALTYIDAVQAAPHVVVDVQKMGCDFLVCSAYKFFGPHQGILWGRREILESLDPYKVRPASSQIPDCFETGTQSHEGMVGTAAAVDYFASLGKSMASEFQPQHSEFNGRRLYLRAAMDMLFEYEVALAGQLLNGLQDIPGVRILGISQQESLNRRVPTVCFVVDGMSASKIAEELAAENIFVWSGCYYAVEASRALGILDTGGAVRVGPVHYNSPAEVDRFLEVLESIVAGYRWR
jgi:cysteine desulfurase family protein (TIGR01976 family)